MRWGRSVAAVAAVWAATVASATVSAGAPASGDVVGTAPAVDLRYADAGPHPVGVTTWTSPTGLVVEIWYPAAEGSQGTDGYDVRDLVPEGIRAVLTADVPATFEYAAGRDAPAAAGSFPAVVFSHGFAGFRTQSTFLTAHLASWGFVVASPDHTSRDLFHVLENTATGDQMAAAGEVWLAYDALVAADAVGPWAGHVADGGAVLVGHSAGGSTVVAAGADPRAVGVVSLAGGRGDDLAMPPAPTLFMAGANDAVVPPAEATVPAFEAAAPPSWYWELAGVGHNGFDDLCTIGGGRGLIGVAEASGLGPFLDTQPQFRSLGLDGCLPPNRPVAETFPFVRHAVTSFARWRSGLDDGPVELDAVPTDVPGLTIRTRT